MLLLGPLGVVVILPDYAVMVNKDGEKININTLQMQQDRPRG